MATATVTQAQSTVSDTTKKVPGGGVASGITDKVQNATTGILGYIEGFGNWVAMKGKQLLDRFFPPEKRASFLAKIQAFLLKNPKLSVGRPQEGHCFWTWQS
jgi:hypothetical protein